MSEGRAEPMVRNEDPGGVERRLSSVELAYQRVRAEALAYRAERDQKDQQIIRLRTSVARTEQRLAQCESQLREARMSLARLRGSRTVVTGSVLGRALHSPRLLLRLPIDLVHALRKPAPVVPAVEASKPARAPGGRRSKPVTSVADCRAKDAEQLDAAAQVAQRSGERLAERMRGRTRARVAAIVDDFTRQCLGHECELVDLHPATWQEEIEAFGPDLLLVESAWRGEGGSWHNTVPKKLPELLAILAWCREHAVPTVFWNKEDPVHFETFLAVAGEFDHVFTTDVDCVGRYRDLLGHDRVGFLPFAAEPAIHHPIERRERREAVMFAGGYYLRYPERMRDLGQLVAGVSSVLPLEIYDRHFGTTLEAYSFPEEYRPYIVGTLPPSDIDLAYKGYRYALNLNSVKGSQSMSARRVYELVASNTLVLSNYARGLSVIFGGLVPMTDSEAGARAWLEHLRARPDDADRLRATGLRKVLREHTYAERLAYVIATCEGAAYQPRIDTVAVVAVCDSQAGAERLDRTLARLRGVGIRVTIVTADPDATALAAARGWTVRDPGALAPGESLATLAGVSGDPVAVLDPDDHYGPDYLCDLAQAWRYAAVDAVGKPRHFEAVDGRVGVPPMAGREYAEGEPLELRRAMVTAELAGSIPVGDLVAGTATVGATARTVSIHRFDYCRRGADLDAGRRGEVDSTLEVDQGTDLTTLYEAVDRWRTAPLPGEDRLLGLKGWRTAGSPGAAVEGSARAGGYRVVSRLPEGDRDLVWVANRAVRALWDGEEAVFGFDASGGPGLGLVVRFLDDTGALLASAVHRSGVTHRVPIPPGAQRVRFGLRVDGPGTAFVHRVFLGPHQFDAAIRFTSAPTLLVTDNYPQYDSLYRNAFVHARVRGYRARGVPVDVFRLRSGQPLGYHEFEGVDVATGGVDALRTSLEAGGYESVVVHFLSPAIWSVLRDFRSTHRIRVWLHGADVQAWWRRSFNFTEEQLVRARADSEARQAFWREVFTEAGDNVHFVFVSRQFAEETFADLGVTPGEGRYSVIHNPVDTDLFDYRPKDPASRLRILSLRPYVSPKYANDLAVEAVRLLSAKPWFGELRFTFLGDGPIFAETLAPLREYPNVDIRRGFLTHAEIRRAFADHGVLLIPTRSDTHGVSRDEAMSAGLVPVTTDVSAVPEFVSDAEGYLAPYDDAVGLAAAIEDLYLNPSTFLRKSEQAARRVRQQSSAEQVIPAELALIAPGHAFGGLVAHQAGDPRPAGD